VTVQCIFRLGGHLLAVDATRVQEVMHAATVTPVLPAPKGVAGVVNLRGEILTAIDLRARFMLPATHPAACLVIRDRREAVCVLVDAVCDVVDVTASLRETVPTTLDAEMRAIVVGTYQQGDALVLEVDPSVLVDLVAGDRRTETR
jgi:purine-binding chemotaxis protein CheW